MFNALCRRLGVRHSMGRVGACFDNAAAEVFLVQPGMGSPVTTRPHQPPPSPSRCAGGGYGFYNHHRRHSAADMTSPIDYETKAATLGLPEAA
ncbi:MAG: hypothetical protein Q4D79_11945 [Propionibacteriaceae bacterium]|nr:hypothetical protein [Propionibacteriaceae bacterium]